MEENVGRARKINCQLIVDYQLGGIMQYNGFEFKIIEQNNRNLNYMKAMAEMLKELNQELKEEKYSEQEITQAQEFYARLKADNF